MNAAAISDPIRTFGPQFTPAARLRIASHIGARAPDSDARRC